MGTTKSRRGEQSEERQVRIRGTKQSREECRGRRKRSEDDAGEKEQEKSENAEERAGRIEKKGEPKRWADGKRVREERRAEE